RHERLLATARALRERARALETVDPVLSLQLAIRAARLEPNADAEDTLRTAIAGSRLRAVLPGGDGNPVSTAAFSSDGRLVLTVSHQARLFDARSGRRLMTFPDPVEVRSAAIAPSGREVVTGGVDGKARLWRIRGKGEWLARRDPIILAAHAKPI